MIFTTYLPVTLSVVTTLYLPFPVFLLFLNFKGVSGFLDYICVFVHPAMFPLLYYRNYI